MRTFPLLCLLLAGLLFFPGSSTALDCGSCGAKGLSGLAMYCPFCKAALHTAEKQQKAGSKASLAIDILYTGDRPDRLPEYGKLYINGRYRGNIEQTEREARRTSIDTGHSTGLGFDYTARYHTDLRDLAPGVFRVEVEMKFKRLFGLARSIRRVCFPHVGLRSGEKTLIQHTFSRGSRFQERTPASAPPLLPYLPGLPAMPSMSELLDVKSGTGTLAIEMPFFE
ncbi:MAG TPA: hypothetical protein VIV61_08990 [Candidatus Ozemobacteraceae bacterium]